MIKTLELHNFQAHKFTSMNLHEGVNVIKGRSHSGKTSIVRAIRWALQNKPEGEAFRNWHTNDKAEIKVAIEFDDTYIIRTRSKKNNGYRLPDNELNAIGRELPEEVQELSRMNDLNLQSQHDTYFMLQDSASSALQRLNEVVGLEIIGDTLKKANKKNFQLLNESRTTISRLEELDAEIAELEYLDFAGKVIEKIERDIEKKDEAARERITIQNILATIKEKMKNITEYNEFLESETLLVEANEIVRHIKSVQTQLYDILQLWKDIGNSSHLIQIYEERLKQELIVERLLSDCDKIKTLRSERTSLESLCQSIGYSKESIEVSTNRLTELQMERDNILVDYEICPLCGQAL